MSIKKILFNAAVISAVAIGLASCAGNKTKAGGAQTVDTKAQAKSQQEEFEAERLKLEHEMKMDSLKRAHEIRKLEQDEELVNAQNAALKKRKVQGQRLEMPCMEEVIDDGKKFLGGYGVSAPHPAAPAALQEANNNALNDIAQRLAGVMKSASDAYVKSGNAMSGNQFNQNMREGVSQNVAKKVFDKYANSACREVESTSKGMFVAYIGVKIHNEEVAEAVATELEVLKVEFDKERFKKNMFAELEEAGEKQKTDLEALQNKLQQQQNQ
jgi:hypothetical protein